MADGFVIYEGPGLFDGKPVVVIATGVHRSSTNSKVGPGVVQTWILPADQNPAYALSVGEDTTVCGDCPLRGKSSGGNSACYVNVSWAPAQVWKSYRAGSYQTVNISRPTGRELFGGRQIRFGAYGDPAAVPTRIWRRLAALASSTVGYTHGWRYCDQELRRYTMASVESVVDKEVAKAAGWRTFRVRTAWEDLEADEFACPASEEEGKRLTCSTCMACWGADARPRHSPAIVIHGTPNHLNKFINERAQLRIPLEMTA